jgi:hypothetical protein
MQELKKKDPSQLRRELEELRKDILRRGFSVLLTTKLLKIVDNALRPNSPVAYMESEFNRVKGILDFQPILKQQLLDAANVKKGTTFEEIISAPVDTKKGGMRSSALEIPGISDKLADERDSREAAYPILKRMRTPVRPDCLLITLGVKRTPYLYIPGPKNEDGTAMDSPVIVPVTRIFKITDFNGVYSECLKQANEPHVQVALTQEPEYLMPGKTRGWALVVCFHETESRSDLLANTEIMRKIAFLSEMSDFKSIPGSIDNGKVYVLDQNNDSVLLGKVTKTFEITEAKEAYAYLNLTNQDYTKAYIITRGEKQINKKAVICFYERENEG